MNREEWEKVFVEFAPRLALLAMIRLGLRHEDAVDAVQHAFVRLARRLDPPQKNPWTETRPELSRPIRTPDDVRRYMLGSVRSYASHLRERIDRHVRIESFLWTTLVPEPPADPEARLITKEQHERLWQAINQLEEPYRSIFTLRATEELNLAGIAKRLQLSLNGVYNQYQRGRRHLAALLKNV